MLLKGMFFVFRSVLVCRFLCEVSPHFCFYAPFLHVIVFQGHLGVSGLKICQ